MTTVSNKEALEALRRGVEERCRKIDEEDWRGWKFALKIAVPIWIIILVRVHWNEIVALVSRFF